MKNLIVDFARDQKNSLEKVLSELKARINGEFRTEFSSIHEEFTEVRSKRAKMTQKIDEIQEN